MGTRSRRLGSWKPTAYKSHRPRPIRRLVYVLASAALLSAVLAVVGATSASAGGTWSSPKTIDDGFILHGVSCPNGSFCIAVDQNGNAFTYNGSSWSSASNIDGSNVLESVSCPSATFCAAVDQNGDAVT